MIIVQITDTHIEEPGSLAYERFDTAANLRAAVEAINRIKPLPAMVLHTGDMAHHGSSGRYEYFRKLIADLEAPFYAIPGNHDGRDPFRKAFSDTDWMPKEGTFLHYTIDNLPVRVVCCDSVRAGEVSGGLCKERQAWLDQTLAKSPNKPTIVAMHHPPFGSGMTGPASNGLIEGGADLAAILRRHPQVIRLIAGHAHRPFTCQFGGTIGFAAPTTCYPFALEMGEERTLSIADEPPAFTVHLWMQDAGIGEAGLVTHIIPIGNWGEPLTLLRDGRRVLSAA